MTIGKNLFIILTLLFSFLITNITYAVESNEEFAAEKSSIKIFNKSGSAEKMAKDFIRKTKKWKVGLNTRSGDKGDFYVSIGTSAIRFNDNFDNFADARQDAFDIAYLQSKKSFIKFMGQKITTDILMERKSGSYAQPPVESKSEMDQYMDEISNFEEGKKLRTLLNLKLDQALKDAGHVDTTTEEAAEEAEKILQSNEFQKSIEATAEHRIAGFQTYKVFEVSDGNKGDITVIGLWSKKLNKLADALSTGGDIPLNTPKKPLMDQIPGLDSEADLMRWIFSYGARMTTDENGNPSIIAFGHASPLFDDTDMWVDACDQAELQASSFIAVLANEIASYKENLNKAQNTKVFEDKANLNNKKAETESIKNYYKQLQTAGFIDTAGGDVLDYIQLSHPINENALECISAVGWSTSLRAAGENFKDINQEAEKIVIKEEEEEENEAEAETEEENQEGSSYSGTSDEADDDF